MSANRIIIAGGSGFIGRALTLDFLARGYEVVILTRSPRTRADAAREVAWDGRTPGEWCQWLESARAVINLTGKNINCPHTPANLRDLIASRENSVKILAETIVRLNVPPTVWVQASATGFYGDTGDRICDETSPVGSNALATICQEWEAAFQTAKLTATRRVILRIGFVLGRDGGALPVLRRITQFFLGGTAGSGKQFISWIHLDDLVRLFGTAVENADYAGTYNAVAPNPVTNAQFMRELRRVLRRPWSPPAPVFGVKLGARLMGSDPALALISSRCVSRRLKHSGFTFQYFNLPEALINLV